MTEAPSRKLIPSFIWMLINEILTKGLNVVAVIYLSRKLSVENFGIYSYVMTIAMYGMIFADCGMLNYGMREYFLRDDRRRFSGMIQTTRLFGAVVFALCSTAAGAFLTTSVEEYLFVALSFLGVILYTLVPEWLYKAVGRTKELAIFNLIGQVLYLIPLFFFLTRIELVSVQTLRVAATCITCLIVWLSTKKLGLLDGIGKISGGSIREAWKGMRSVYQESFLIGLSSFMVLLYYNVDVLILGLFKGMHEVGIYSAYYKFVFVYLTIKGAIVMSLFSRLSLWCRQDFNRFQAITRKVTWLAVIAFIVTAVPGLIWGKEIVTLVFGAKYVVSNYNWILIPLCLSVAFTYLNLLNPTKLLIFSCNKLYFISTSTAAIANVCFNVLLIPRYSYIGAAISTCCSEFVMLCITYFLVSKYLHLNRPSVLRTA